jgi:hypothetical protein
MKKTLFFIAITILSLKTAAFAGSDIVKTIEFIAFSEDSEKYLVKVVDANVGTLLIIRETKTGNKIKQQQVTKDEEPEAVKKLEKTYKLKDKGQQGNASPDGKYIIMGARKDDIFKVMVMKGEKITSFQKIELKKDGDKVADGVLKSVIWSSDGNFIIIILHQKLASSWGVDADFDYPFEFRKSSLNFK